METIHYDICVLGLGYIGLPTASIFATKGKKVLGVDVVERVVHTINDGRIHIEEPDLDILVKAAVQSGNLRAASAPASADVYIIAVPTPFKATNANPRAPDLHFVESAARSIASVVPRGALVILESTSPVGTTEKIRAWLADELAKVRPAEAEITVASLQYVHCPERILPGQMLKELVSNDRIAGGLTHEAGLRAQELYRCFCTAEIIVTEARTAEMAKLTENSFRDVNIAFANELSMICSRLDIDVWEVIALANRHPRVKILQPGPGVGGHCIAVDPWFIVDAAPDESRLIRTAREVNDHKPHFILQQVQAACRGCEQPVIACLGLAFKADVDDLRESPALEITAELARSGLFQIIVVEPYILELPVALTKLPNVRLAEVEDALRLASVVVLLVNHRRFAGINRALLHGKTVIDTRGFWR